MGDRYALSIRWVMIAGAFWLLTGAGCLLAVQQAEARAGYAKWVKHGTAYRVEGNFGPYKQTFTVRVAWKGNGFVIHTPLGTHRLKRKGRSVAFKVYFDKAWASVTWSRSRAQVIYKGQKGTARVQLIASARAGKQPAPRRKQNFNLP